MYCARCGAQNTEGSQFCSKCGAGLLNTDSSKGMNIDIMQQKRKSIVIPIIIISAIIVLGACIFLFILNSSSGTSSIAGPKTIIVYQASDNSITDEDLNKSLDIIKKRFGFYGFSKVIASCEAENRIRIEVPAGTDVKATAPSLGECGLLKFMGPDGSIILTNPDVKNVYVSFDENNDPQINLEFTDSGRTKFADATKKFIGQKIGIYFDENLLTEPTIQAQITDGAARITGMSSTDEAKQIASLIKSGISLPCSFNVVDLREVN